MSGDAPQAPGMADLLAAPLPPLAPLRRGPYGAYCAAPLWPHVAHCCVMLGVGLLVAHVQVTTRLLMSSCPALYWFAAAARAGPRRRRPGRCAWLDWIAAYFFGYTVVGTVLFCSFYPWT